MVKTRRTTQESVSRRRKRPGHERVNGRERLGLRFVGDNAIAGQAIIWLAYVAMAE